MKTSPETRRALANLLSRLRNSKNLTQETLASISGIPLRSVQRAESNGSISQENLAALASALESRRINC